MKIIVANFPLQVFSSSEKLCILSPPKFRVSVTQVILSRDQDISSALLVRLFNQPFHTCSIAVLGRFPSDQDLLRLISD